MGRPPTILAGRRVETQNRYDDPDRPERITSTVKSPEWTSVDRDLLVALTIHEATLCPGCGHPKALAWHSHTAESWAATGWICHACTTRDGREKAFQIVAHSLTDDDIAALPSFEVGETTTEPTPPEQS